MLQPRFIVNRYSLGGDTENSNTAWVRTLWVGPYILVFKLQLLYVGVARLSLSV